MEVPERAEVVAFIGGGVRGVLGGVPPRRGRGRRRAAGTGRARLGVVVAAAGGVRACFSDPLNVALGLRSLDLLADFGVRPGHDIDLQRVGYLFPLTTPQLVEEFTAAVGRPAVARRALAHLDGTRRGCLSPLLASDDVLTAVLVARRRSLHPRGGRAGYAGGARRAGARLVAGVEVTRWIELAAGAVSAVRWRTGGTDPGGADEGVLRASTVVCCAGAWSHAIGAMVGSTCRSRRTAATDRHRSGAGAAAGIP